MTKPLLPSALAEQILGVKLYAFQKQLIDQIVESARRGERLFISASRRSPGMATVRKALNELHSRNLV